CLPPNAWYPPRNNHIHNQMEKAPATWFPVALWKFVADAPPWWIRNNPPAFGCAENARISVRSSPNHTRERYQNNGLPLPRLLPWPFAPADQRLGGMHFQWLLLPNQRFAPV